MAKHLSGNCQLLAEKPSLSFRGAIPEKLPILQETVLPPCPCKAALRELSGFQNKVHEVEREKWWGCGEAAGRFDQTTPYASMKPSNEKRKDCLLMCLHRGRWGGLVIRSSPEIPTIPSCPPLPREAYNPVPAACDLRSVDSG